MLLCFVQIAQRIGDAFTLKIGGVACPIYYLQSFAVMLDSRLGIATGISMYCFILAIVRRIESLAACYTQQNNASDQWAAQG